MRWLGYDDAVIVASRQRQRVACLGAALASLMVVAPQAQAFRCGSRIVTDGDHYTKVRKFCGEPLGVQERVIYREGRTRPRATPGFGNGVSIDREVVYYDRSFVEIVVEEWTYNFGPRRLMQLVRFENGFVVEIEQLGYGFTD